MTIIFFYVILQFPKFTISKISSSIVALFSPISHQPSSSRSTIVEVTSARQMVPREKCVWPNLEAAFFFLPPPLLAPVEHARERERNQDAIHGPMTVMQPRWPRHGNDFDSCTAPGFYTILRATLFGEGCP